jgi:hypothetical protein
MTLGLGPGAAVERGVPVLINGGHAPPRPRVPRRRRSQVPGHPVQLRVRRPLIPVIVPGGGVSQERQLASAGQPVGQPALGEPSRPGQLLPGSQLRIRVFFLVIPARTRRGLLTEVKGGVAPRFPVLGGHPVRSGNGVAGLGGSACVSRSSRHDHHPVRNEDCIENSTERTAVVCRKTPYLEIMYDILATTSVTSPRDHQYRRPARPHEPAVAT